MYNSVTAQCNTRVLSVPPSSQSTGWSFVHLRPRIPSDHPSKEHRGLLRSWSQLGNCSRLGWAVLARGWGTLRRWSTCKRCQTCISERSVDTVTNKQVIILLSKIVHIGFVKDRVVLKQVILQQLQPFLPSYHFTNGQHSSITSDW